MGMVEWYGWTENLKSGPSQIVSAAEGKWQYKRKPHSLNSVPVTSNDTRSPGEHAILL